MKIMKTKITCLRIKHLYLQENFTNFIAFDARYPCQLEFPRRSTEVQIV